MKIEDKITDLKELMLKDIKRAEENVFNGLLGASYTNSIPESIFVNYFLPRFIGQISDNNWIVEWVSIAGTPVADVAVYNDVTKDILFVVPGLFNTSNLFLNRGSDNLDNIFGKYRDISRNIPSAGFNYLMNALHNKQEEIVDNIKNNPIDQRWLYILTRYGIYKPQAETKVLNNQDPDMFEY